ncbi:MAG TPA: hypothetical protein VLC54_18365 [Anaeromyxobacter sp.]|nr:hypothetical protein [Anaeromyxobacter sp.]
MRVERDEQATAIGPILAGAPAGAALVLDALDDEARVAGDVQPQRRVGLAERRAPLRAQLERAAGPGDHLRVQRRPRVEPRAQGCDRVPRRALRAVAVGEEELPARVHHPTGDPVDRARQTRSHRDAPLPPGAPSRVERGARAERRLGEQRVVNHDRGHRLARPHREPRAGRDLDDRSAAKRDAPGRARAERDLALALHEPDGDERLATGGELKAVGPEELERIGEVEGERRRRGGR